jgi:hypothetical protein
MAGVAGIEYPALVRTMCELGLDRNREGVSVEDGWALAQRLSGITTVEEGAGVSALDLFAAGREDQSARIGTTPDRDAASVSPQHHAVGDH